MDQRIQEQHGALGTEQGRTAAYDAGAAAYFDAAGADQGGEGDGAAASDDASAAEASAGNGGLFFPEVLEGLKGAEAAAREAGRQGLARAYEELRTKAVANLEIALAHAHLAQTALKWDAEDFATISIYLAQANRCFAEARNAVLGRMQLSEFDAAAQAAQAPQPAPAAPEA